MEIMDYNVKAKVIDLNTDSDILKLRLYFDQLDEAHTINIKIAETANPNDYQVITSFLDGGKYDEYEYGSFNRLVESLNGGEFNDDLEIEMVVQIETNDEIQNLIHDYANEIYQCENSLRSDLSFTFLDKEKIKSESDFYFYDDQTGQETAIVYYRDDYYLCNDSDLQVSYTPNSHVHEFWEPGYLYKITGDLNVFIDQLNEAIDNNELDEFMSDHSDNSNLGYPELTDLKNRTSKEIECTLSFKQQTKALSM